MATCNVKIIFRALPLILQVITSFSSRCVYACVYVCVCTVWCSEIGSLQSRDAPELHSSSDVREPISLHRAVCVYVYHHQECPIRLGKFSRMRNHSISKTATAELGRARPACSSITTCAASEPRPTAILSCRYGPHEKSWKIGLGPLDLKSRPSPHCWVRRNSRESTNFHFGPVEGGFQRQRTTTKDPSLHTNCNWLRPQGLKAFLPNFST